MNQTEAPNQPKMKVKKRGNALGLWFFEMMLRISGLKGAYLLLEFVFTYYVLFDREAAATSLAYIEKRFPNFGAEHWLTFECESFGDDCCLPNHQNCDVRWSALEFHDGTLANLSDSVSGCRHWRRH